MSKVKGNYWDYRRITFGISSASHVRLKTHKSKNKQNKTFVVCWVVGWDFWWVCLESFFSRRPSYGDDSN